MCQTLLTAFVGVFASLAGAWVAGRIAAKQQLLALALDTYSEVIAAVGEYIVSQDDFRCARVNVAVQRGLLLCSDEAHDILRQIAKCTLTQPLDTRPYGYLIPRLRTVAEKEKQHYLHKHKPRKNDIKLSI